MREQLTTYLVGPLPVPCERLHWYLREYQPPKATTRVGSTYLSCYPPCSVPFLLTLIDRSAHERPNVDHLRLIPQAQCFPSHQPFDDLPPLLSSPSSAAQCVNIRCQLAHRADEVLNTEKYQLTRSLLQIREQPFFFKLTLYPISSAKGTTMLDGLH